MTIAEWLNSGRNYQVGVALYDTYGGDELMKQMFAQGYSELREKRLAAALLALNKLSNIGKNGTRRDSSESDSDEVLTPVFVESFQMPEAVVPENKDPYRKDWPPLYLEMNLLRHSLEDAKSDVVRGEMAFKILQLERQCMSIWARRDYFLKYGREIAPEQAKEVVTNRDEMYRRIVNLRCYVCKYSKPSTKPAWEERLRKYSAELKELEKRYKEGS